MRRNRLVSRWAFTAAASRTTSAQVRERGLITQEPAGNGMEVIATEEGHALVKRARPVHAAAVRRYLQAPRNGLDLDNFRLVLERLGD